MALNLETPNLEIARLARARHAAAKVAGRMAHRAGLRND
jgi:hypothetical protein